MMSVHTPSRRSSAALAVLVAVTTLAVVGNAVQTVTMPNISSITYSVAPGGNSPDITIPILNSPVLVMGSCTTLLRRGVAHVSILRVPTVGATPGFLEWAGISSPTPAEVVGDYGTGHIVWLDWSHQVRLRAVNASAIDVQSTILAGGQTATGYLKLIW